jgi:hypothetical protein
VFNTLIIITDKLIVNSLLSDKVLIFLCHVRLYLYDIFLIPASLYQVWVVREQISGDRDNPGMAGM